MLRPPEPAALDRLRRAVSDVDSELDSALSALGILPPVDLDPIRRCLSHPSVAIAAETNRDGHRRLALHDRYGAVAWIDHDGTVTVARAAQLAAGA